MSGAIAAVATAVSAAAANTAAFLGASSAVIEAASSIGYSLATIGITTGISAGIGAALAPKVPDPQALQFPLKQPMAPRQSAFGRVRVAGSYVYFGTGTVGFTTSLSVDVLALLDGRSAQFVSYYLNDDLMAPVGSYWYAPGAPGKYGGGGSNPPNLVQFDSRLGLDAETSYSEIAPALPLWDANHRGDGVTSMLLLCKPARREDQSGDFPNGLPTPSAVIDAQLSFDPRDESQTQGDKSTYKFSDNPVLCLLAYLTDANGGMGLNYARFIAPAIDLWISAADECDGLVSTSGMHATLLDAAAVGDNKIFLADTTGLEAGAVISLPTEDVTVSGLGLAGEVDLTSDLLYSHSAGELAYWNASGQSARYRCAGTYQHDTPPGDVVKSILSTFDGWLGQRGDGALVVRTNTIYDAGFTLSARHITGYGLQQFVPDEQATNQYVVSYTDPASAFNKAEAGYVQDDIDIAARGTVRSNELYLQWVPSGPQAITVARAMLARSTQQTRLSLTCNLSGLGVLGHRYVPVEIVDGGSTLFSGIIEITGKPTIDLASMSVSFSGVATGVSALSSGRAICIIIDTSLPGSHSPSLLAFVKAGVIDTLRLISSSFGSGVDLCVVACADEGTETSIVRRAPSPSDVDELVSFVSALTMSGDSNGRFAAWSALDEAKTAFFDGTDAGITARQVITIWENGPSLAPNNSFDSAAAAATLAAIEAMPDVSASVISYEIADDGRAELCFGSQLVGDVPLATSESEIYAAVESDVFGTTSTPGAGYTLPTLAPPSGAPLQPLATPTITSVTPVYPNSGGGVAGARLSIVVGDPGLTAVWKVQWKLSSDSVWTLDQGAADASGSPLTILSGLIPASGSIDVQVAYVTASQVSPWSATTTATIAAPIGAAASTSKSASFTTTADKNVYYLDTSGGAWTVTLNATPATNEVVEVWDSTGHAGTNPISFAGNGKNIAGVSSVSNAIQINFGHARLIYDGTQWLMQ
jgi:hypothetical protein